MTSLRTLLLLLAFGALGAGAGTAQAQSGDLEAVSWLQGCWLAGDEGASVEEMWTAPRAGLMMAMSRSVRAVSVTGFEFLLLREVDGSLVLSAYPSGQTPAEFTASAATADILRVENPSHDFPRKIEYVRVAPDSVTARVYGEVDAATPAFELRYGRAPC